MTVTIGINGFGRIGRLVLRALYERNITARQGIKVAVINDVGPKGMSAHLLKYDSVHGVFNGQVSSDDHSLNIEGDEIAVISQRDPSKINWQSYGIDILLECSGKFTSKELALQHVKSGANRVLVSAPAKDADATVVYGVNHEVIKESDVVVSNASCTTNCLAPMVQVLDELCGIDKGFVSTVHSYTSDQRLLDNNHKDLRRARAAGLSMIPTSTGAARAVGLVLPHLAGKLEGSAVRVPTPNVSMVDGIFNTKRDVSVEEVNQAFITASAEGSKLHGILDATNEPLVSSDYNHNPYSSIIDLPLTSVNGGNLLRVVSWYDNEWGFSQRMLDTLQYWGNKITG